MALGCGVLAFDEAQQLLRHILFLDDGVADVGPVEAADELACVLQLQAFHDVGAGGGVGGGGQGHARHTGIAFVQHRQGPVLGPEVMAPLAHAVRFVDGKQAQHAAFVQRVELGQEARRGDALGRCIQQRDLAAQQPALHLAGLVVGQGRIEEGRIDPRFMQGPDLIVHQGNQRRHHHGDAQARALAHDRRYLVAQ